jgi:hypothetical protein
VTRSRVPNLASPTSRKDANRHPVSTYSEKGHDAQPCYATSQLQDLPSYRIPYKKYGIHSSDVVDVDYFSVQYTMFRYLG